jgi:uncharacterized protein YjiS (DUF1127 family)
MTQVVTPASSRSSRVAAAPLFAGLTGLASLVVEAFDRRRKRREIAELLTYDDFMLADMGITRDDVAASLLGDGLADPSSRLCHLRNARSGSTLVQRRRRRA